jgi:hypothetical protein
MQIFPFTPFEIMPAVTNAGEKQNKGNKTKATKQRQCKRKVSGLAKGLGNKKYINLLHIMGASKCAYCAPRNLGSV